MPEVLERRVWCTTRFEGKHRYRTAPKSQNHLRSLHRHVFHVRVEVFVEDGDRDVEFLNLKDDVGTAIHQIKTDLGKSYSSVGDASCEHLAKLIAEYLLDESDYDLFKVEVSEDGENGATVLFK